MSFFSADPVTVAPVATEPKPKAKRISARDISACLFCLAVIAGFIWGPDIVKTYRTGLEVRTLAKMSPFYEIQILQFTIATKPGDPVAEDQSLIGSSQYAYANYFPLPGYMARFDSEALPMTLSNPDAFLDMLRQRMPGYDFQLQFFVKSMSYPTGTCEIDGGPGKNDPEKVQIHHFYYLRPSSRSEYSGSCILGQRWFSEGNYHGDPLPTVSLRNGSVCDLQINRTRWISVGSAHKMVQDGKPYWVRSVTARCLVPR